MNKWTKWALTGLGALAIAGGVLAFGPGSQAMASGTPWMEFMPKIMQQRAAAQLSTLVKDGTLTQDEADQLQALMKSEMESRMANHNEENHGEGQMQAELARLVEEGKLSPELAGKLQTLMPSVGKMGMGHGKGMHGHNGAGEHGEGGCPVGDGSTN